MSEQEVSENMSSISTFPESAGGKVSLGQWLVAQRTEKGLSAQDVASRTNRPLRQVVAVETDDYKTISTPILLRAIVRHYAKSVGADEATALAYLPETSHVAQTIPLERDGTHVKSLFPHEGTPLKAPWIARKWLLAVLSGVVLFMLYSVFVSRFTSKNTVSKVSEPNQVQVLRPPEVVSTIPVESGAAALEVISVASDGYSAGSETVVTNPLSDVSTTGDLVLKFKVGSWVEVKDADGFLLLTGVQAENTEQALLGKPPLKVKIGNANQTEVVWKGDSYDLEPVTKGGVARFSVE